MTTTPQAINAPEPAGMSLFGGVLILLGAARKSWLKRAF